MKYRALGRSGIKISDVILGAMMFGDGTDWIGRRTADLEASRSILRAYVDAGGNTIDTANIYGGGLSEQVVGRLIAGQRDRFVISTKYTITTDGTDPNATGGHRKSLRRSLDESLRRLDTEYIDLYWVHVWDATTPIDELMRGLDDAVSAGKILAIGISNAPAWVVSSANVMADLRGWTPFSAIQVPYSAANRDVERELLPMADALGLAITAWQPLAGGLLTGRAASTQAADADDASERRAEGELAVVRAVHDVATSMGVSDAEVALAWLLARSPAIHPVLGASRPEQLTQSLGALEIALTDEQRFSIDQAGAIDLGFPTVFFDQMRQMVHGQVSSRLAGR